MPRKKDGRVPLEFLVSGAGIEELWRWACGEVWLWSTRCDPSKGQVGNPNRNVAKHRTNESKATHCHRAHQDIGWGNWDLNPELHARLRSRAQGYQRRQGARTSMFHELSQSWQLVTCGFLLYPPGATAGRGSRRTSILGRVAAALTSGQRQERPMRKARWLLWRGLAFRPLLRSALTPSDELSSLELLVSGFGGD